MALFGFKKKDTVKSDAPVVESPRSSSTRKGDAKARPARPTEMSVISSMSNIAHILRNPRITEKATMHAGESVYLFDVVPSSTKRQIVQAVSAVYKVTPRMVRIVTIPAKRKRNSRTGRTGVKQGGKKAYVYLKKGETITLA